MVYIHNNRIVHGSIKGANILVTEEGRACIADRDFSSVVADIGEAGFQCPLEDSLSVVPWRAPELLLPMLIDDGEPRLTPATDVYALACLSYEVRSPFCQVWDSEELTLPGRFSPTKHHSGMSRRAGIRLWPCSRSLRLSRFGMNAPSDLVKDLPPTDFMG